MDWITVFIACAIYSIVINPIEKVIKGKIHNKIAAYILVFAISVIIFMFLYWLLAILGL